MRYYLMKFEDHVLISRRGRNNQIKGMVELTEEELTHIEDLLEIELEEELLYTTEMDAIEEQMMDKERNNVIETKDKIRKVLE